MLKVQRLCFYLTLTLIYSLLKYTIVKENSFLKYTIVTKKKQ